MTVLRLGVVSAVVGAPPVAESFGYITESGDQLVTESDDILVQE